MNQLNKWQQELENLSRRSEVETNKKLHKYYQEALREIKKEVKQYIEQYDELSFSKKLEAERLMEVGKHMDSILSKTYSKANQSISNFSRGQAEQGYYGTWYAIEGAENIQLDMSMLPERYIQQLVNHPVKGKTFSKRLYDYRDKLAKNVTSALNYAAVHGQGYAVAAKRIGELTEASYKQAFRIARTEGGRVQSTAKQRSYKEAKKKGVDLKKKWLSTLDGVTRDTHRSLDGQVVEVDEEFESSSGAKAEGPRLFGVAEEDIHCRCTTVAEVEGISSELRKDNETGDVIDYKNYNEWYNDRVGKSLDSQVVLNKQISSKLSDDQLSYYQEMINKLPDRERNLWQKYENDLEMVENLKRGNAAYFTPNNGVTLNADNDIIGSSYSKSGNTFFHEFGHHIDYSSGSSKGLYSSIENTLSNGKTLGETVYDEVQKMIKSKPGKMLDKKIALREELQIDFNENNSSMASISDLYGGSTNNQLNLGIGHKNGYWKPPKSRIVKIDPKKFRNERLGKEAFAEMFSANSMDPEEVEMLKKWLPESYRSYEELVDKLLKGD